MDPTDPRQGGRRLAAFFAAHARACLGAHPHARAEVVDPLARALIPGLAAMCRRALALELEATRLVEVWPAQEAAERAARLLHEIAEPALARALLAANPALARLMADRTAAAIDAGGEILDRLHADLPRVVEELLEDDDGAATITDLTALGDRHDGGRRVVRITFASGVRVLLKPRSLHADVAYHGLLEQLNELGFKPPFRCPRTLASGPRHGWQSHVAAEGCAEPAAVERYFRRFGGQLAVLYALRATDMHQENVIACGEHPTIIDLETLLQPRLGGANAAEIDPLIGESAIGSVLRVGLLPRPDGPMGADISGVGRDPDARAHVDDDGWTSKVDRGGPFSPANGRLPVADNAARLHGAPVRPHEYVDALARGFEDAYRLLAANRRRLLAPGGALRAFDGIAVRLILRATQAYIFVLQRQVTDDGCLVDGLAREAALDVLWRAARGRPDLIAAAPGEHHDLWRGDIPKLTARAGESDLHHHALGRIPGALGDAAPPSPDVVGRLDERDLARQLSWVRTAMLASARDDGSSSAPAPPAGLPRSSGELDPVRLRRHAAAIGERLAILALHDGDRAGWLALVRRRPPREGAVLTRAGADLADGQAGIALFLARLAHPLAGAAAAQLAWLLAEADDDPEARRRGGLRLALAALGGAREPSAPQEDNGLAAWVAGSALASEPALARDARRLATLREHERPPLAAYALARAAATLRDSGLAAAATAILRDGGPGGDPLLDALAWAALPDERDALFRAASALASTPARSDARRLAAAVALRDAAALLDHAALAATARDFAVALDATASRFERSLEMPGLRDGLAGIGLACLALAEPCTPAVVRDALAIAHAEPHGIETAGSSSRSVEGAAAPGQSSRCVAIRARMT